MDKTINDERLAATLGRVPSPTEVRLLEAARTEVGDVARVDLGGGWVANIALAGGDTGASFPDSGDLHGSLLRVGARPVAVLHHLNIGGPSMTARRRDVLASALAATRTDLARLGSPTLALGFNAGAGGQDFAETTSVAFGLAHSDDLGADGPLADQPIFCVASSSTEIDGNQQLRETIIEVIRSGWVGALELVPAEGLALAAGALARRSGFGTTIDLADQSALDLTVNASELRPSLRFLVVPHPSGEARLLECLGARGLRFATVGRVSASDQVHIQRGQETLARLPLSLLRHDLEPREVPTAPWSPPALQSGTSDIRTTLLEFLGVGGSSLRGWIEAPAKGVDATSVGLIPRCSAAALPVQATEKALIVSLATDFDVASAGAAPAQRGAWMIAAATRSVSALGARPLALVPTLSRGLTPAARAEFEAALVAASEALAVPVACPGPVMAIPPAGSTAVAVVGLVDRPHKIRPRYFRKEGEAVVLVGAPEGGGLDLAREARTQALVREALQVEFCSSVQGIGAGGLVLALAASCLGPAPVGARIRIASDRISTDMLFAESPSWFLLSMGLECLDGLSGIAEDHVVPVTEIGEVGGSDLQIEIDGEVVLQLEVAKLHQAWQTALLGLLDPDKS